MNCGELRQKVYLFYYGELSAEELEDIYIHLQSCNKCEEEKNLIARILEILKDGLVDEPVPLTIREKIFSRLKP